MKLDISKLQPLVDFIRQYIVIIVIVFVGLTYGYIIFTSGQLANSQPSEEEVNKGYTNANRPKMDEAVEKKLSELQESNVKYQTLVNDGRDNPFQE